MSEFGLAKNDRIYLRNDFKAILERGLKVYGDGIVLWHRPSPQLEGQQPHRGRIGIIVSTKLGNAVCRVRCKRLLREVFRLNRHLLNEGADIIVRPQNATKFCDYASARAAFFAIAKKAKILKGCKDL